MVVQEGLENSPAVNAPALSRAPGYTKAEGRDSIPQSNADLHEFVLFFCPADCRDTERFSLELKALCVQRNPKFRASQWKFFVFS